MIASPFHPYSLGVFTNLPRLVPKVIAETRAATATTAPAITDRFDDGASVRGSSANRSPTSAGVSSPAPAATATAREGRACARGIAVLDERTATAITHAVSATTSTSAPSPSTVQSMTNPLAGSTARTDPKGISGDAANANATASRVPTTVAAVGPTAAAAAS